MAASSARSPENGPPRFSLADERRGCPVFWTTIQQARDAIVITTADLNPPGPTIVYVNPSFTRMTGYTFEEAVGKSFSFLLGPKTDRSVLRKLRRQLASGKPFFGEAVHYRKDGSEFMMEMSVTPVRDESGAIAEYVAVERDVTQRRRVQEAACFLARANEVLASSLDYARTLENVVRLPVPELADVCAIFGLPAAPRDCQVTISRLACYAGPDAGQFALDTEIGPFTSDAPTPVATVLRTARPCRLNTVPAELHAPGSPNAGGTTRKPAHAACLLVPMVAQGRPVGLLVLVSVQPGRQYGSADLTLGVDLASRAALAIDNARAYQRAQQAIADRDRVLALVSHDLRSPLTVIGGQAQLMARELTAGAPLERDQLLKRLRGINRAVARSVALIEELLDVARMQRGQALPLQREPTDLVQLSQQAVDELLQATPGLPITLQLGEASIVGCWDPARLERVVANLLGNAVKYSPERGEIAVRVDWDVDRAGRRARLVVADHGIGIPAADLPHIFQQYHRAGNVIGRIPGTGLGLASCKYIVESLGGTIEAHSVEGQGSTFVVRLPLS